MHRSWGFGRITTVDTVFSRLTIDFQDKPGHSMDLGFAVQSLKPIGRDHILARKYSDLDGLRQLAAIKHLDLIKIVLDSYEGKATVGQIQSVLVPDVIADDWKKWWEVARREMKKNGHFTIPLKKAEPIVYHEDVVSLQDRLIKSFGEAKGLKARVAVTGEIVKSLEDFDDPKAAAEHVITALSAEIQSHLATQPGTAIEAIFARDDLAELSETSIPEGAPNQAGLWQQEGMTLLKVISGAAAAKHRRVLASYKAAFPDSWAEGVLSILNESSAKLCGECANLLGASGRIDDLKSAVGKLINQHQASSELLLWLAKERSDAFADILGPEVFRAMLTAIERDQFNDKKSSRLGDYIMDDKTLVTDLFESADIEVIKDIVRALKLSGSFDDMDTRSLLARVVKQYPAIQSLISGDKSKQDQGLVVSWLSLEQKRKDYDAIVRKKIPANSKEIAIARSYGDLRENHEYKAAKENQKILMTQKVELERDLMRARGTDFKNPRTDVVSIGTTVAVTEASSAKTETYSILGAWDSAPDQGKISYETPLAQALLTHAVGETVEFTLGDNAQSLRIDRIEAYEGEETAGPTQETQDDGPAAEGAPDESAPSPSAADA